MAACAGLACLPVYAVDLSGLVDLRAVHASSAASWTREGLGKLRYDQHNDGLRLGQAMLRVDGELLDTVSAAAIVNAADDRSKMLDITEGWVRWNPLPGSAWKHTVRAGQFFPHLSLENDGLGWTPTRSISTSAINSWVGEELRTRGIEFGTRRRGRAAGDAADKCIDCDLALKKVGDLQVGRPDPVHHVNRETMRVERAAGGEDDRRCRSSTQQYNKPERDHLQKRERAKQRSNAVAVRNDPSAGDDHPGSLFHRPQVRAWLHVEIDQRGDGELLALRRRAKPPL